MSAYVVSTEHIDAMVRAGLAPSQVQGQKLSWRFEDEWRELTHANADQVGSMLLSENVRSVDYRYSPPGREQTYGEAFTSEDDGFNLPGTYREEIIAEGVAPVMVPEWLTPYTYRMGGTVHTPVQILKAIDCFEYQSCETDDWPETEAHAFCAALRDKMINALPGYSEAAWEIS